MKIKNKKSLTIGAKNKLLRWCKMALKISIDKEEFEDSGILSKLIKAIENNNDKNIEKYFNEISNK
jgi:hypothetical protein